MTLEEVIADCEKEISDCQIDLDGIAKLLEEYPERREAFAHDIDDYKKRMDYNRQLAEWLKELQERRKSDNEIPFGNASFSELDSIINAYEVHGNHKKVVELLKELRKRRKHPEIIFCKDCKHYHTDVWGGELGIGGIYGNIIVAHNACDKWTKDMNCVEPEGFCFLAERRADSDGRD